jgi:arylsulfatase A
MDWYPTLATYAGIRIPDDRVVDGRDLSPYLSGITDTITSPIHDKSLNSDVPLRRSLDFAGEWSPLFTREEYLNAFFYHGSHGALAAVRSGKWKLVLNPTLQLYDLSKDLGETAPTNNREISRKLRGMAVTFQEEMSRDGRKAGFVD